MSITLPNNVDKPWCTWYCTRTVKNQQYETHTKVSIMQADIYITKQIVSLSVRLHHPMTRKKSTNCYDSTYYLTFDCIPISYFCGGTIQVSVLPLKVSWSILSLVNESLIIINMLLLFRNFCHIFQAINLWLVR